MEDRIAVDKGTLMHRFVPKTVTAVAAAALTLSLVGCGGSDSTDETSTAADVEETTSAAAGETTAADTDTADDSGSADASGCDMIDLATLESITGQDFTEPIATGSGGSITCDWEGPEGTAYAAQVSITDGGATSTAMTRKVAEGMFEDVVDVDVPGASDAFSYMGGTVVGMSVGDDYVQVLYMDFFAEDSSEQAIAFATAVVGNL